MYFQQYELFDAAHMEPSLGLKGRLHPWCSREDPVGPRHYTVSSVAETFEDGASYLQCCQLVVTEVFYC